MDVPQASSPQGCEAAGKQRLNQTLGSAAQPSKAMDSSMCILILQMGVFFCRRALTNAILGA